MGPPLPERIWLEEDRLLHDRDPNTFTDAEAITRLVQVEAKIAEAHALRARLVSLVAAQRPASGRPPRRAARRGRLADPPSPQDRNLTRTGDPGRDTE